MSAVPEVIHQPANDEPPFLTVVPTPEVAFYPDNIPEELRAFPWWAPYEMPWNDGRKKFDKVPRQIKSPDFKGSTSNPKHWGTFDEAVAIAKRLGLPGVGICMTWSKGILVGYDLDNCLRDGVPTDWAKTFLLEVNGYGEVTPSREGLRIMCLGSLEADWTNHVTGIEVYGGTAARFLTITGDVWPGKEDIAEVAPEVHVDLKRRFCATKTAEAKPKEPMPDLLEGVEIPLGLPPAVYTFITEGDLGGYGDRSKLVTYVANSLIDAGLDRQQTLSLMVANEHVMDVALSHRRQDEDRAIVWLWDHHVCTVKATGPLTEMDFEDVSDAPKWAIPSLIANRLKWLAKECEMEVIPFCKAIQFKPKALRHVIDGVVFNQTNSKFVVVTPEGEYRVFTEKNYARGLKLSRGTFYGAGKLDELLAETAEKLFPEDDKAQKAFISTRGGAIGVALSEHISVERQFGVIEVKVDMFVKEASIRIDDGTAIITFPHVSFREEPFDPAVIADFIDHWPMLDEFIDLLVSSRFAAARKKAYVWLRAESDWGKGALEAVLSNLGLVVAMSVPEIEKVFSGGPVGRQMNDFKRAWVLLFNEFKSNKSELKMLEQSIGFAPKNLPICKVELFLKLFTSAEAVESLVSDATGVEDQFANRFSLIQPTGNLDARPLFASSRKRYLDSLTAYVARELNRKVGEYLELGREGAADKGDKFVIDFHKKYGISNSFERLSTKIKELCQEHLDWIHSEYLSAQSRIGAFGRSMSPTEKAVYDAALVKDGEDGSRTLYIKTAAKILTLWLEVSFNAAERGKLTVKSEAFRASLPEVRKERFNKYDPPKDARYVCQLSGPTGGLEVVDVDDIC